MVGESSKEKWNNACLCAALDDVGGISENMSLLFTKMSEEKCAKRVLVVQNRGERDR